MPETILDSPTSTATHTPVLARKPTVLLVEDDAAVRRYLEVVLRRAGYEVLAACNGLEAIKAAVSSKIDAVVTDALMPHLNGHELCRYLRSRPELSGLPILLLSGLDSKNSTPQISEHADAHLTKPVRPEVLTDCLARLISQAVSRV